MTWCSALDEIRLVTSRDNPKFKELLAINTDTRHARQRRRALIDGPHLISAYLDRVGFPELLVLNKSGSRSDEVIALCHRMANLPRLQLADGLFRELAGVTTPVGIMAVIPVPETPAGIPPADCVLLDAVQDPGNVGAILRTAAAAGIEDIVLGRGCAGAWSSRVLRAAQGAHFLLRVQEQVDLVELLSSLGERAVAAVARSGTSLYRLQLDRPVAWVFGNEGAGVSLPLIAASGRRVTIPMADGTESLNVGIAAAVCLFEAFRQRLEKGALTRI